LLAARRPAVVLAVVVVHVVAALAPGVVEAYREVFDGERPGVAVMTFTCQP